MNYSVGVYRPPPDIRSTVRQSRRRRRNSYAGVTGSPEISVFGNGVEIAAGDTIPSLTDHTDFGSSVETEFGVVRSFTVDNTGNATLTITQVLVPLGFTVIGSLPETVRDGACAILMVQADTSAPGTFTGDITIQSDDADEAMYSFRVTSTVTSSDGAGAGGGGALAGALNGAQRSARFNKRRRRRRR